MSRLQQGWYTGAWLNYALWPLSLLFWLISSLRRLLYRIGVLRSYRAARPLIIVGNISVGGNGKTPFVIWLVELLKSHNIKAGVISRGYGGHSDHYPVAVDDSFDTAKFGDEPVLIYQRTGCPVVVGSDRVKSSQLLVEQFGCDLIISDDGLQHYRLQRDIEVVIVDGTRLFGNGWLMPVGPLRELVSRLKSVDHIVYNGPTYNGLTAGSGATISFELVPQTPIAVNGMSGHPFDPESIHGISGIGNPDRFKQTLTQQGFNLVSFTPFADHHQFSAADLAQFGSQTVLMTEKDAVKCRSFAQPNWWYLPVNAQLPAAFTTVFLTHIQQVLDNHGI